MSTVLLGRKFLQEIEDLVFEMLTDFEDEMVKALVDNKGLSYGDMELDPQERIMKYVMDEMGGVNAAMERVDEDEARRRRSQFSRDAERQGVV